LEGFAIFTSDTRAPDFRILGHFSLALSPFLAVRILRMISGRGCTLFAGRELLARTLCFLFLAAAMHTLWNLTIPIAPSLELNGLFATWFVAYAPDHKSSNQHHRQHRIYDSEQIII
jgi:RsiW-degrading membrane proteinase PrsW (M82 family)